MEGDGEGTLDGDCDGSDVLGVDDGVILGIALGCIGAPDGNADGAADGDADGSDVEGLELGVSDGAVDGEVVGSVGCTS